MTQEPPLKRHDVVASDYLAKIAVEHDTTVAVIWNHPANAAHVRKRGTPDVLYPGDVLWIPARPTTPLPAPPNPIGLLPPTLPVFPRRQSVRVAPGGGTNTVTVRQWGSSVSHSSSLTAYGFVNCARAALANLKTVSQPAKAWMSDFLHPVDTHRLSVRRDLVAVANAAPWLREVPPWYRMAITAMLGGNVHLTSGNSLETSIDSPRDPHHQDPRDRSRGGSLIRTGFEGKDVPYRHYDVGFLPDTRKFGDYQFGLTTPATNADHPQKIRVHMNPALAANTKGLRFASQISVWLMDSYSKARLRGNGEGTITPHPATIGTTFFHELALHAFPRMLKADPSVDAHDSTKTGDDALWADRMDDYLTEAMCVESEEEMGMRLLEAAGYAI